MPNRLFSLLALLVLLAGVTGCASGAGDSGPSNPPQASCMMRIGFASSDTEAPAAVSVEGSIDTNIIGFERYSWEILYIGESLASEDSRDGRDITFEAIEAGIYTIRLDGQVDNVICDPAVENVNFSPENVMGNRYRLRFVPRADQPAPIQAITQTLPETVDYNLGTVALSSGVEVAGTVVGDNDEPISAYIRATKINAGLEAPVDYVEAFADDSGRFVFRLSDSRHDYLIVPADSSRAPARFDAIASAANLGFKLPSARTFSGDVRDPNDSPLDQTSVSLRSGPVPSTMAITDALGMFSLKAQLDSTSGGPGPVALIVVPPEISGLPWLTLSASDTLAAALTGIEDDTAALAIAYDSALSTVDVAPIALAADASTALAGVRATWIARADEAPMDRAGTMPLADGTVLALTGTTRITITSDQSGAWPTVRLPRAVYDVILEPELSSGAGHVTVRSVDLRGLDQGPPPTIALAASAILRGNVVDDQGDGLANIRVTATPVALLTQIPGAGAGTVTDADGSFSLALVSESDYELTFDALDRNRSRVTLSVATPSAGALDTLPAIALPTSPRITGRVTIPNVSGGASGVTVQILCDDDDAGCRSRTGDQPLAETITDGSGYFVLAAPPPTAL